MYLIKAIFLVTCATAITLFAFKSIAGTQLTDLEAPENVTAVLKDSFAESVRIDGAVRVNYSYKEYDEQSRATLGSLDFELFRLNVTSNVGQFKLAAQYRWYSEFSVPEYAYISFDLTNHSEFQLGLNKVPFGVLPYSSFGYWESILYHLGLEDDNDLGLKYTYASALWEIDLGFYKNAELSSANNARYSFDIVTDTGKNEFNREENQFNVRVQKKFRSASLGLSLQYGELYNEQTLESGEHSAYAVHLTSSLFARLCSQY
jgi:hypothetical protein